MTKISVFGGSSTQVMCFIDSVEYRLIRHIGLVLVSISVLKLSAVGFEPGFQSPVFSIPVGSNAL